MRKPRNQKVEYYFFSIKRKLFFLVKSENKDVHSYIQAHRSASQTTSTMTAIHQHFLCITGTISQTLPSFSFK